MIKRNNYSYKTTVLLRVLLLGLLSAQTLSIAQVINPMQAGVIENGSPISPNLTGATSIYTLGNYAYVVGSSDVLEIFDISLPGAPLHKGTLRNGEGGAAILKPLGVVVAGNYAYICNNGGSSLEVVDVSDPAKPVHKTTVAHGPTPYLYLPQGILISGNFLYLPVTGTGVVEILDISNPGLPVHKGVSFLSYAPVSIALANNIVYVGEGGAIEAIDVSNPAEPVKKSILTKGKSGVAFNSIQGLTVMGNYLFAIDYRKSIEIIDISNPNSPLGVATIENLTNIPSSVNAAGNVLYVGQGNNLDVFDVSKPSAPEKKTSLNSSLFSSIKSITIAGAIAYVADQSTNSMIVLDITNSISPTIKTSITTKLGSGGALLNDPQSVYVSGHYAYVADKKGNGLEIIDISNPSTPTHKGSLTNGTGANFVSPTSVFVSGNYAYVVGNGSLEIVDVTNLSFPTHKGVLMDGGINGPYLADATSIFVLGDYAYITSKGWGALEVVNISNPAAPYHATGIKDNSLSSPESVYLSSISNKNYAFIACSSGRLAIVDVSNLSLSSLPITKILPDGNGNAPYLQEAMSVFVSGSYAYVVSRGSRGLEIVDVTVPTNPTHKGFIKDGATSEAAPPYLNYPRAVYVSGNTAFVASGYLSNTSFASGLEVIDVTNPATPTHKGSLINLQQYALLDNPTSIFVSGDYAYITNSGAFTNLNVVYLYGASITDFTPKSGAVGTSVTVTGKNFNTFIKASINGIPASITSVNATSLSLTIPSEATVGRIVLNYNNQNFTSTSNFVVAPIASAASAIQQSSFTANWSNVGAVAYLDVSTDGFANFVDGYNAKYVGRVTNFSVSGLSPGKTYQYRVRCFDGATSSVNSNIISVSTLPATPTALEATFISQTGFTVNWTTAPGADSYAVDVAYDDAFSNFVVGYNNLVVPNATATKQVVTGLNPYTKCYYRVRSTSLSGSSSSSNTINVTSLDIVPPTITSSSTPNPSKVTLGNTPALNVIVTDNVSVTTVELLYRGISETTFKTAAMQGTGGAGGNYSITLQTDWYDSLGLEYYFKGTDQAGNSSINVSSYIQLITPSITLPTLPSGTDQSNYRIIAFPYQLTDNKITTVYNNVPWSDNTKAGLWWWNPILKNGSGDYDQYTTSGNLQTIEPGKGYWIITRTPVSPTLSNVPAPKYNQSNLYSMTLKPGWNQIGNPYPVPISWDKVIAYNQTANPGASFGPLTIYDGSGYKSASGTTLLSAFEGGFVRNLGSSDVTIQIPFPGQNTTGGRMAALTADISQENWNIPLHINQNDRINQLGGFGMHRLAKAGIDRYDNFNPPSFLGIPEVSFTNAEHPNVVFSNDMVQSQDDYTWTFTPSGKEGSTAQLTWNNELNTNSSKELFLLDEELLTVIDMSSISHYDFVLTSKSSFRIFYGNNVKVTPSRVVASSPFPNPLNIESKSTINIALPESGSEYSISMQVFNAQGGMIGSMNKRLSSGIYPLEFSLPPSLAEGIYIYKLALTNDKTSSIHTGKIIKP